MPIQDSYNDFVGFAIRNVVNGGTGSTPDEIDFEYANPAVGIDTGGNFIKHDIIGGATVRQRIGDKPLEISVSGVCTEEEAQKLEQLRNAEQADLYGNRFNLDSITVHVVSISTRPMEDGGAADLQSGEFLYTFDIQCVEILDLSDETNTQVAGSAADFGQ